VAVGPTRRAMLAASAAAVPFLATACRGIQVLGTPPPPAPDIRVLRSAIAAEQLMIARYRAAIRQAGKDGPPGQAAGAGLTGLLSEHEQHLAQLRARLIEPAGYTPPRPGSPAAANSGQAGLAGVIGALATDEQAVSDALAAQLLAVPPSLAQLLASISASEATHVPVLRALRQAGRTGRARRAGRAG
jgi:hypothetical protein